MEAKELARRIRSKQPPCVVDVRSRIEYRSGHIPGAVHLPFWKAAFKRTSLPDDKSARVVLTCEHGPRAQLAQATLRLAGYRNLDLLEGHMSGWRRIGLPLKKGQSASEHSA